MGNTKLGLTNLLMQSGVVLKNGSGGSAPAVFEDAGFPMSNLLFPDRETPWKSSVISGPFTEFDVDFDLGSSQSVNAGGVHGFTPVVNGGPQIDVLYQTGGTYAPAGTWFFAGTMSGTTINLRDGGVEFNGVSARFWRFAVFPQFASNQFLLGKFFLYSLTDLGGKAVPGRSYSPFQNRLETPQQNGSVVIQQLGLDSDETSFPWVAAPSTQAQKFLDLQQVRGTFTHLDEDGHWFERVLRGGRVRRVDAAPNLWNFEADTLRLP